LLDTENVTLDFTDDGIDAVAEIAAHVNASVENIGARRLQDRAWSACSTTSVSRRPTGRVTKLVIRRHLCALAG